MHNNNSLKHVTQVKDLGVNISPDLKWDTHINTILAKANRMLASLRGNSVMSFITDHRRLLYLTFVRYHGYACEVWAPSTICSITKIESLQRRASKFILNTQWQEDISYHKRLSRLNLLPLTYWHEVKDLIFLSRWPLHVYPCRWLRQAYKHSSHSQQLWSRLTNSQVPHKAHSI